MSAARHGPEALSLGAQRTLARVRRIAVRVALALGALLAVLLAIGAASGNLAGTFFSLLPLVVIVPAFTLIVLRVLGALEQRAAGAAAPKLGDLSPVASAARPVEPRTVGALELRPDAMRRRNAIFLSLFALFWNAFVAFGLAMAWSDGGFTLVFLGLFVVAGLALAGGALYQWAQTLNPRPVLTLARGDLALGDEVGFGWHLLGRRAELSGFRIRLRGSERATYQRGTDKVTQTHVFHDALVFETDRSALAQRGSATLRIPADSMHSFSAPDNGVLWNLVVEGDVPRWPDIRDELEIQVAPRRDAAAALERS